MRLTKNTKALLAFRRSAAAGKAALLVARLRASPRSLAPIVTAMPVKPAPVVLNAAKLPKFAIRGVDESTGMMVLPLVGLAAVVLALGILAGSSKS